jgi:hypothetical protein
MILTILTSTHGKRIFATQGVGPSIDASGATPVAWRAQVFNRPTGDCLVQLLIDKCTYVGTGIHAKAALKDALDRYKEWRLQPTPRAQLLDAILPAFQNDEATQLFERIAAGENIE